MENGVHSVTIVSDGILVEFTDGTHCYYSAQFLKEHVGIGSNQVFLNYNPEHVMPTLLVGERHLSMTSHPD